MEYNQRQEFRINKTMKKFFLDLGEESSSAYLRNLVEEDIMKKRNPDFIKNLIKQKKVEIEELEKLLIEPHPLLPKAMNLIKKHARAFKENAQYRTVEQRHNFIEKTLMPELKKFGFHKTVEEIEQILLNLPDENNGGSRGV